MSKYRKLIVAVLGAVIIAVDQFFGVSVGFDAEQIVTTVIPLLTAVGVWRASND